MTANPEQIAASLNEAQRERLLCWPVGEDRYGAGVLFETGSAPDDVANSLVAAGLCNFCPWKHGSQLAMLPPGLAVRRYLQDQSNGRALKDGGRTDG